MSHIRQTITLLEQELEVTQGRCHELTRAIERRAIPGWPGYEADDAGQIWSLKSGVAKTVAQTHMPGRYQSVGLFVSGKRTRLDVHVLIATTFHGPKPPGCEVRHLDGDKLNNRQRNLAWGTKLENAADAKAHGRTPYGDRNGMSIAAQKQRILETSR